MMVAEHGSSMLVSVVIPAWGTHVRYLLDAVTSVTHDQNAPVDVIVVDNASSVGLPTLPVAVRVIRTSRQLSVGAARNAGLDAVATPYVLFWDADDVMLPGTLAALVDELSSDPGAVAACARIIETTGADHHWPRWSLTTRLAHRQRLFLSLHSVSSLFPTAGAVLIRTDALRHGGGFPAVDGGDDWVAGVSLAARGRVAFVDHRGRLYRRHSQSVSTGWGVPDHVAHAREVRKRLAADREVPAAVRRLLPVLAALQFGVVHVLGPVRRTVARSRSRLARPRAVAEPAFLGLTAPMAESGRELAGNPREPTESH